MEFFHWLFSTNEFMQHGMCYEWNTSVITLHVVSDGLIALAYYSIPFTLIYFVRKRRDMAFDWMFICFAVFIVACGTTHLMEILNIWYPVYWLAGWLKAVTAFTSIVTAILLIRLLPQALALPSPELLRQSNEALQNEIQERTRAAAKVAVLNSQLLDQTSRLEESNKELETFAYSVSHDLRAPLRHIDGYVDLLRGELPPEKESTSRYMNVISGSAKQMGNLIDSLLVFSRMGRADLYRVDTDTSEMVEQVREELSSQTAGRNIEWKVGELPHVMVDKTLFKQVWMNLLSNAIKYTKKRDQAVISISCESDTEKYQFTIKDNGAGFDMRYKDKLFGVFQRLHHKEEFEGTGIGLANVHRIIARHGGRTWAEGKVDEGATFYFTVPKTPPKPT